MMTPNLAKACSIVALTISSSSSLERRFLLGSEAPKAAKAARRCSSSIRCSATVELVKKNMAMALSTCFCIAAGTP